MIDAFSVKDRKNLIRLITYFEGVGVTDPRFIRMRLEESVTKDKWQIRVRSKTQNRKYHNCPSCGEMTYRQILLESPESEEMTVFECKRCKFSEVHDK